MACDKYETKKDYPSWKQNYSSTRIIKELIKEFSL